ncbi:YbhN family protein [Rhodovulum sp. BSW8]|uniref:YbhN family protein n=1 Tax=Rhodovulum sp. BSW8 TaxID=2259645 RepID=UPI00105891A7|nr:YbhN family protein [Rhodovulum sp. BSW8]
MTERMTSRPDPAPRRKLARTGRLLLTAAFIGIAVWLLREATRQIEFSEITDGLQAVTRPQIALAVLGTLVSFVFIGALDLLCLKEIAPGRVPGRVSVATGAAATAVSNLLGAAYVTGVGVRYRVYSVFGLGASQVAVLFAHNSLAYSLGALVLYGAVLAVHPASIEGVLPLSPLLQTVIGLSLLALTALIWGAIRLRAGRPVRVFGRRIPMPGFGTAVALTGAVVFDLVASGLVLHVLYPPDLSIGFLEFLAVFGIAISLGILSHSPGGLGVFEATILTATGAHGRADALAALILYRAVYTLLPFLAALVAAGVFELRTNRAALARTARRAGARLRPAAPAIAAGLAFAAGGGLLLSGLLEPLGPEIAVSPELRALAQLLAMGLGLVLLALAGALALRLRRAPALTPAALAAGSMAVLAEGRPVEAALLLGLVAGPFWLLRRLL